MADEENGHLRTSGTSSSPAAIDAESQRRRNRRLTLRAAPTPPATQERGRPGVAQTGSGKITVNGRDGDGYFARPVLRMIIGQPFDAVDRKGQYDIWCTVAGGGPVGQAGAVRHGISPGAPAL